jgi:hypothetical protein
MKKAVFLFLTAALGACVPATVVAPTASPTASSIAASTNIAAATETAVHADDVKLEPFVSVRIDVAEVEFDVDGDGRNVDSIAFWEADDPLASLMLVTSKGNESIEVYQYPYQAQLRTIACGKASNGVLVDQDRDVLYITKRGSGEVCAYNLPALDRNESLSFATAATRDRSEPNLAMLELADGSKRIYVSYDERVYYHHAETGDPLGEFSPSEGLETMYGDDYYQMLYIPDEGGGSGIYLYDQDGDTAGPMFGDRSIFDSDAEGISVYRCLVGDLDEGEGLIVVADQKEDETDLEVFDRKTKEHLGKINIAGVNNTDGIAITQQSSPEYPLGLLAVIDDDASTVGVGWDVILTKTGLSCGN